MERNLWALRALMGAACILFLATCGSRENKSKEFRFLDEGLVYEYYTGEWASLPNFHTLTPQIKGIQREINTGSKRVREDYYALRFTGFLYVQKKGEYTFHLKSDEGSRLYLNDLVIVNNDVRRGNIEKSDKIFLGRGLHTFELQYYERVGSEKLRLEYEGPGISKQALPEHVFYHKKPGAHLVYQD